MNHDHLVRSLSVALGLSLAPPALAGDLERAAEPAAEGQEETP